MSNRLFAASAALALSLVVTGCGGGSSSGSSTPPSNQAPPPVRTVSFDNDADGAVDAVEQVTYERTFSKPVDYRYDDNNDGVWDYFGRYVYDDSGNLLERAWDSDADGIDNIIETRTFDSAGRVLSVSFDNNADGVADRVDTNTFDAAGNRLVYATDSDGDGINNYIETRTYSADNDVLSLSVDSNGDGSANRVETWTYSAPATKATYELDSNADGAFEERWLYTYTSDIKLLTLRKDTNADGLIDYSRVDTYTDFANGDWQSDIAIDSDNDGNDDEAWQRLYNSDRLLLADHRDNDLDGLFDSGVRNVRNSDGKITLTERLRDEVVTRSTSTTYNADGNETLREQDNDADGNVDNRTSTSYSDWDIGEVTVSF